MNYFFYPAAEIELNEAIDYYNKCQDGLGLEFAKEAYSAIQNILSFPQAWTPPFKKYQKMSNKSLSLQHYISSC